MSLEAWGDEGNVPQSAEDTAVYQEWLAILERTRKWKKSHEADVSSDTLLGAMHSIVNQMDAIADLIKADFQP